MRKGLDLYKATNTSNNSTHLHRKLSVASKQLSVALVYQFNGASAALLYSLQALIVFQELDNLQSWLLLFFLFVCFFVLLFLVRTEYSFNPECFVRHFMAALPSSTKLHCSQ